jgi:hypothetical protein
LKSHFYIDTLSRSKILFVEIHQNIGEYHSAVETASTQTFVGATRDSRINTENEILLFNPNGSLRLNRGLPDVPEQFSAIDDNLVIELMEGDRFSLNLQTGQFRKLVEEVLSS